MSVSNLQIQIVWLGNQIRIRFTSGFASPSNFGSQKKIHFDSIRFDSIQILSFASLLSLPLTPFQFPLWEGVEIPNWQSRRQPEQPKAISGSSPLFRAKMNSIFSNFKDLVWISFLRLWTDFCLLNFILRAQNAHQGFHDGDFNINSSQNVESSVAKKKQNPQNSQNPYTSIRALWSELLSLSPQKPPYLKEREKIFLGLRSVAPHFV